MSEIRRAASRANLFPTNTCPASRNAELVAALEEFVDAAQYDAMMEGPKFKGWNRSQLDRALVKARAALSAAGHKQGSGK